MTFAEIPYEVSTDMAKSKNRLPRIPKRKHDSHKGTFGRVALVGGSLGMAGAVVLAGHGTLLSGAGLVDLVVPERIVDIVSCKVTSQMVKTLSSNGGGVFSDFAYKQLDKVLKGNTVIAAGPGMRTGTGARNIIKRLLLGFDVPLIIDADGLNCLSILGINILKKRKAPVILTPHPGEMERVCGLDISTIQKDRVKTAVEFAKETGVVLVLKGNRTVVSDGTSYYVNKTGNPGMAVGGSGDVLTGIIAGLAGSSGLDAFSAACIGCYIHGEAGDSAARSKGEISMTAEDILENLSASFKKYTKGA